MEIKSAIQHLKSITKDKVVAYSRTKDGELVLITDNKGSIGCNHYIAMDFMGQIVIAPTNPVACGLQNDKTVKIS